MYYYRSVMSFHIKSEKVAIFKGLFTIKELYLYCYNIAQQQVLTRIAIKTAINTKQQSIVGSM